MVRPTAAHMVDWMLNMVLAVPIVMFRRGSIDLLGLYVNTKFPFNSVIIFFVGCLFIPCFYIYPIVHRKMQSTSRPVQVLITRIMFTIGSVLLLTYWKGVWGITDYFFDEYEWKASLLGLIIVHGLMVFLQTCTTLVFTPFFVSCDELPNILIPNNVFSQKFSTEPRQLLFFTMDVLFTHFINNTLVVLWFRHMFKTLAYLPIPQENFGVIVLVIGIGISFIFLLFEIPLAIGLDKLAKRESKQFRNNIQENLRDVKSSGKVEYRPDSTKVSETTPEVDIKTLDLNNNSDLMNTKSKQSAPIQRKVLRYFSLTKNEFIRFLYMEAIFAVALFSLSMYWLGILEVMKIAFPDDEQRTWFCFCMGWLFLICGQGLSSNGLCGCSHDLDFIYPHVIEGESPHFYNNYIVRHFQGVYLRRSIQVDSTTAIYDQVSKNVNASES